MMCSDVAGPIEMDHYLAHNLKTFPAGLSHCFVCIFFGGVSLFYLFCGNRDDSLLMAVVMIYSGTVVFRDCQYLH